MLEYFFSVSLTERERDQLPVQRKLGFCSFYINFLKKYKANEEEKKAQLREAK